MITTTEVSISTLTRKVSCAMNAVSGSRQAITAAVTNSLRADQINKAVLDLAYAEGQQSYWALMLHVAKYVTSHGDDDVAVALQKSTLKLLTQGADDVWSGRGNDVKRAQFDGLRAAAEVLTF